jgi:hypothetical protein
MIHVLVETKDPELVDLINQVREMEKKQPSEQELMMFMLANRDKLRASKPVLGLVKFGMEKGKEERKVEGMYSNLSPDVILLKEGERPDPIVGILIFVAGMIVAVLIFKFRGKSAQQPPSNIPPPLPSSTPPPLPGA